MDDNIKVGTCVYINDNISLTDMYFSSNRKMRSMAGDGVLYKVQRISDTSKYRGKSLRINEYVWHPKDVRLPNIPEKPVETFIFNIDQLDITGV